MNTQQIQELNVELIDEVRQFASDSTMSTIDAFTSVFLNYLSDAGETRTADCEVLCFKNTNEKIRINGYVYNEYFQNLTLVVSEFEQSTAVEKIGKVEAEKLLKQATKFFRLCKTDFFSTIEEASPGYSAYEAIRAVLKDIETITIILLTNKIATIDIPRDIQIDKVTVKYDIWDLERIWQNVFQKKVADSLVIRLKSKYKTKLPLIKVDQHNDVYDCYVGVISGELLAQIYKDEGQKLIEKNVRSFLQAIGKINKGIKETIVKEPEMFMAYNNGISTIAEEIVIDQDLSTGDMVFITEISGWQIVNGGQTTASIYNALQCKNPLDGVNVQIKLNVIKNSDRANEIIGFISKYANSQNEIKMSDFAANDDYHIAMERLSRTVFIPTDRGKSTYRWFYERARGQYSVELNRQPTPASKRQFKEYNPKSKKLSKTVAAKCIMLWQKKPYIVARGLETNFVVFSELVNSGEILVPSEKSYISMIAKVILFNECDRIVASQKFGDWKAQQNYYTISLLAEYFPSLVNDIDIWRKQTISAELATQIEGLAYKVWNHFMTPEVPGTNVGQWCKKEECWTLLKRRYEAGTI